MSIENQDDLPSGWSKERLEDQALIDIWKKTIDVQQHFNDIELRIRNLAITLVVAVFGVVAYSMKEEMVVAVFGYTLPLGSLVLIGVLPAWLAFYFMDRYWYHRLLLGAVDHARDLEKSRPELGLTGKIGKRSPLVFRGGFKMHSTRKVDVLYWVGGILLIVCSIAVYVASDGSSVDEAAAQGAEARDDDG